MLFAFVFASGVPNRRDSVDFCQNTSRSSPLGQLTVAVST